MVSPLSGFFECGLCVNVTSQKDGGIVHSDKPEGVDFAVWKGVCDDMCDSSFGSEKVFVFPSILLHQVLDDNRTRVAISVVLQRLCLTFIKS